MPSQTTKRRQQILAIIASKRILLAAALFVIAAGALMLARRTDAPAVIDIAEQSNKLLTQLPQKSGEHPAAALTGTTSPQPTNKWFSGIVYSKDPMPIYAKPLSYKPTATGFELGYSAPKATATAVTTPHTADIIASYKTASRGFVSDYDDLTVKVSYKSESVDNGNLRLIQGSPYAFGTTNKQLFITGPHAISRYGDNKAMLRSNGKTFLVTANNLTIEGQSLRIESGDFVVMIVPSGANVDQLITAAHPISSARVDTSHSDNKTTTTYSLSTKDNQPTIWAPPFTETTAATNPIGSLDTLGGKQLFYSSKSFTTSVDSTPFVASLDVSKLSDSQKQQVVTALVNDIDRTNFNETNTYGAGKQLYRAAALLRLSQDLGQTEQSATIAAKLSTELNLWLAPLDHDSNGNKTFYYDTTVRGIVGQQAAFGSEQFNDHYFHYGYMIYAAAELQHYNKSLTEQQQQMTQLLIRDIASKQDDDYFPKLRHFDSYAGHSWASGYSIFGDGNNQESTSEAIMAWSGIANWATATNDKDLLAFAQGLLDRESNATNKIWLNPPSYPEFTSPLVSLVWGSRLDYTTWFSGEPAAKLGIQLIPMSPTQQSVLNNLDLTKKHIASIPDGSTTFRDYIAMYAAADNKAASVDVISKLTTASIDSANSRAYALAWALTR